jgi:hypothetical protein
MFIVLEIFTCSVHNNTEKLSLTWLAQQLRDKETASCALNFSISSFLAASQRFSSFIGIDFLDIVVISFGASRSVRNLPKLLFSTALKLRFVYRGRAGQRSQESLENMVMRSRDK